MARARRMSATRRGAWRSGPANWLNYDVKEHGGRSGLCREGKAELGTEAGSGANDEEERASSRTGAPPIDSEKCRDEQRDASRSSSVHCAFLVAFMCVASGAYIWKPSLRSAAFLM
ncbi:hypothetical protein MRX96_036618 [Rhipicephalus microplus]